MWSFILGLITGFVVLVIIGIFADNDNKKSGYGSYYGSSGPYRNFYNAESLRNNINYNRRVIRVRGNFKSAGNTKKRIEQTEDIDYTAINEYGEFL